MLHGVNCEKSKVCRIERVIKSKALAAATQRGLYRSVQIIVGREALERKTAEIEKERL